MYLNVSFKFKILHCSCIDVVIIGKGKTSRGGAMPTRFVFFGWLRERERERERESLSFNSIIYE